MKQFTLLFLLSFQILFAGQIEHINIGNQDFMFTKETYDIYDSKGEVLRVYKEERNNDLHFMFSLILKDRTGPCSEKSLEDGYYEINGTTVTLYSAWNRRGKAYDAPYGARIQVYHLNENYDLERISSKIYIETQRQNYDESSGMQYLFTVPKTKEEKEKLRQYIDKVERDFKGVFLYLKEAKTLLKEVEDAMARKMKATWK